MKRPTHQNNAFLSTRHVRNSHKEPHRTGSSSFDVLVGQETGRGKPVGGYQGCGQWRGAAGAVQ
ncbi:hypothetical protein HaLaN_22263 [Haematococcus lacustris]|uniref:Uncharacterized protein n=1 Tax=Haematococcus lacustris TaxID=44745 RepID=A0A699ZQ99_HAELA|nr:hypothetical protein HaLaN_22263 [Haematococcus lacustris]